MAGNTIIEMFTIFDLKNVYLKPFKVYEKDFPLTANNIICMYTFLVFQ